MRYWGTALGQNGRSQNMFEDFKSQITGTFPKRETAEMELSRYFNRDNVIYSGWNKETKEFDYVEHKLPVSQSPDYPDIVLPIVGFFKILMDDIHFGKYITRRHAYVVKRYTRRLIKSKFLKSKYKPALRKLLKRLNKNFKLTKKFEVIHQKVVPLQLIADKKNYLESIKYQRIDWKAGDVESQFKGLRKKQYSYVELNVKGRNIFILIWKDHKGHKYTLRFSGSKPSKHDLPYIR